MWSIEDGIRHGNLLAIHKFGKRILEEKEATEYGGTMKLYGLVADEFGYELTEIKNRVRFAEKYPDYGEFLKFSNTLEKFPSWYEVCRNHLYERRANRARPFHELAPGRFRCLVIDPPWPMEKLERKVRPRQGRELDYPTMSLKEIGDIPVQDLIDPEGGHVYLWRTHKFLREALGLFERWGVRYECEMTWVKNTGFTPYSWMYSTEHVLFGRVGNLPLLEFGLRLDFSAPVSRHSQKPDVFYERVRRASPEPRLDMFARSTHEGFVPWGDEAPEAQVER